MRPETLPEPATWGARPTRTALHVPPLAQPVPAGVAAPAGAGAPPAATGTAALDTPRLAALSQAVLLLHRGSRAWPAGSFDARAIDTLAGVLPHAACLWGSAAADAPADTPPIVQGLYSAGLDANALAQALAGQGTPPGLQDSQVEPLAGRRVTLRLWRHDGATAFDDADRQALAFVLPHLVEAQRENRLDQARLGDGAPRVRRSLVLCDAQGRLQQVDEHGLALLRQEWPRWLGRTLPEPLVAALQEALAQPAAPAAAAAAASALAGQPVPVFYGRSVTALLARSGTLLLLEIRRRTAADRLSARQRDIARRYAAGLSGPQIAAQLGLSASTVNNHLGVIFKRLGVSSKLQLSDSLRADGEVLTLAD